LTIKERKGDDIEDNYNRVKYQTAAKNVLQAERSDKYTREEPSDDCYRLQERSWKLNEKRRRERNQQIEKKDSIVKIETANKNVFQTERSEKEKRAEPADDFDRRQEPSFEHQGEKETRAEPAYTENNRVTILTGANNLPLNK
jgi:hypothetical protein